MLRADRVSRGTLRLACDTAKPLARRHPHSPTNHAARTMFTHIKTSKAIQDELERGADVWSMFNAAVFPNAINLGQVGVNEQPYCFH